MSLNIGKDIEYQFSVVVRKSDETDEQLAARLYWIQQEIVDANAMGNPFPPFPFSELSAENKKLWLEKAKTYK